MRKLRTFFVIIFLACFALAAGIAAAHSHADIGAASECSICKFSQLFFVAGDESPVSELASVSHATPPEKTLHILFVFSPPKANRAPPV